MPKSNRYIFSLPCGLLLIVLFALMTSHQTLLAKGVKTVVLPDDIKIEENVVKETVVCNLSEEDIFRIRTSYIIDNFLYVAHIKPRELIKLTLNGKVVNRLKKYGRGPGEFVNVCDIKPYNNSVSFQDSVSYKMFFYTKNFELIREFRFVHPYLHFQINNRKEIIFHDDTSSFYFTVYSGQGKLLRRFGKRVTPMSKYRYKTLDKMSWDTPRHSVYIVEKDGIWTTFKNRYDLRYYEKEKFLAEIKGPKHYFKSTEKNMRGLSFPMYIDRSIHIDRVKDRLFYFYRKGDAAFCDIFSVKNCRHLHRIKLKGKYTTITGYKDNIFYASSIARNEEEDLLLNKLNFNDFFAKKIE